jgi:hypothetical protein
MARIEQEMRTEEELLGALPLLRLTYEDDLLREGTRQPALDRVFAFLELPSAPCPLGTFASRPVASRRASAITTRSGGHLPGRGPSASSTNRDYLRFLCCSEIIEALTGYPVVSIPYPGTLKVESGTRAVVGNGRIRAIVQIVGGRFEGPRLKGAVIVPAGDRIINRPDGSYRLDGRLTLGTDDGALSSSPVVTGLIVPEQRTPPRSERRHWLRSGWLPLRAWLRLCRSP